MKTEKHATLDEEVSSQREKGETEQTGSRERRTVGANRPEAER